MSGDVGGQPHASGDGGNGKVEAVKEVAGRTAGRAGEVAGEAQSQAKVVARDAADHVRGLVDRARRDVDAEAGVRSRQAAGAVRSFADQVGALVDGDPDRAGSLAEWMRDGQDRLTALAGRLDDGPSAVLDDVRRFARRQPVLFLASAGVVGFVAGRLLRASREVASSDGDGTRPATSPALSGAPMSLPEARPVVSPAQVPLP